MQNKGALKLLAIALAIACAYQLSFTFVTRHVENKAEAYAASHAQKGQNNLDSIKSKYLDSVKSKTVYDLGFIQFNYNECKEKEINLGLDLRGGMNVMLEISVEDVVRALSNDSKDPVFNQALQQAREAQKNSTSDYITLFADAYEKLSNGGKLSYIFNTPELREQINPNSTNDEVIKVLRESAESAIENSFNVLRNRIDKFGVTQPNIQRLENSGRILVELPGVKEPERVRKLLQGTASLEFWATYENSEIYPALVEANTVIKDLEKAGQTVGTDSLAQDSTVVVEEAVVAENSAADSTKVDSTETSLVAQLDSTSVDQSQDMAQMMADYPLFAKLRPMADQSGQLAGGPVIGTAYASDTSAVNRYLAIPQVKALLPRDVKLLWGVKPMSGSESVFELYAIKANTRDGKAPLDGSAVVEAREQYAQHGSSAEVSMIMNPSGARTWARLTADNVGRCIAIVLDGYVYSAPVVHGEISGGQSSISGQFTINEARDLANVLKSGKLPAPARITQDNVVGPSLGQESINAGMMSFILAFILVLLYMIFYYNKAGMVASIALICNLFFLFGVLVSFGAVLTLPGIAGIVLTMGNVTTLITGIVLFVFGTGPVQGFATTLIIGILTSLFTAILITRLIFSGMLKREKHVTFSNRFTENFLANTHFNFIGKRKITYVISGILLLITIISLSVRGMSYGVDFSGGRTFVVRFDQPVTADQVRSALGDVFGDAGKEVKQFGKENQMRIITQYKYDDAGEDVTHEIEQMLYKALSPLMAQPLTEDEFLTTATNPIGIVSSDKVGPTVAHDIKVNSVIAVLFSLVAIALYIIIRFKRWQWGIGSVISLSLDTIFTIGVFSLLHGVLPFSMDVDQSFIAAILTIIGYSINDKVVIFDRIREYQTLYPKRNIKDNINNAINSTLTRTINTSGTTLVVLLAIFLFGGEVIRGFVFALLFGVLISIYSTVFTATPIAYDLIRRKEKEETK